MRLSLGIMNLHKIFTTYFVMKLFEATFNAKKYSWFSTTATVMQLNLKDDFQCKFIYLYNYFILCLSCLKSG